MKEFQKPFTEKIELMKDVIRTSTMDLGENELPLDMAGSVAPAAGYKQ